MKAIQQEGLAAYADIHYWAQVDPAAQKEGNAILVEELDKADIDLVLGPWW